MKNVLDKFGKHLTFVTYDYTNRKAVYLTPESNPDLPCIMGLRMSASIPLIFDMCKYNGSLFIDGGIADLFPIRKVVDPTHTLGFFTKDTVMNTDPHEHLFQYVFSLLSISFEQQWASVDLSAYDIIYLSNIDVNISNFHLSRMELLDLFSQGYKKGLEHFDEK
jgi:predicted acylesterase/phospholipase RssA